MIAKWSVLWLQSTFVLFVVQTHSSVLKLVRQYRGQMRIIDGALLDFDAALLDANTETYRRKAKLVEQRVCMRDEHKLIDILCRIPNLRNRLFQ